jgi:hypothetical protein
MPSPSDLLNADIGQPLLLGAVGRLAQHRRGQVHRSVRPITAAVSTWLVNGASLRV